MDVDAAERGQGRGRQTHVRYPREVRSCGIGGAGTAAVLVDAGRDTMEVRGICTRAWHPNDVPGVDHGAEPCPGLAAGPAHVRQEGQTRAMFERVFAEIDTDGSGSLALGELFAFFERHTAAAATE